jgi:hypothetical protein
VFFVDLDSGSIYHGTDMVWHGASNSSGHGDVSGQGQGQGRGAAAGQQDILDIPPMPKHVYMKLKAKLDAFGGCIWGVQSEKDKLREAGVAYPSKEHLQPLRTYYNHEAHLQRYSMPLEPKPIASTVTFSCCNASSVVSTNPFGSDASSPPTTPDHQKLSRKKQMLLAKQQEAFANAPKLGILDPRNNNVPQFVNDAFDAAELRYAFLRVFVVLLGDYRDFFSGGRNGDEDGQIHRTDSDLSAKSGMSGTSGMSGVSGMSTVTDDVSRKSQTTKGTGRSSVMSRMFKQKSDLSHGANAGQKGENGHGGHGRATVGSADYFTINGVFDRDEFMEHLSDPLARMVADTQLFMKFIEENYEDDVPEVKFFIDSVHRKRNKSRLQIRKLPIVYINDTSMDIKETYINPEPSNWGVDFGAKFGYTLFPSIDNSLIGPARPRQVLVRAPEKKRLVAHQDTFELITSKFKESGEQSAALNTAQVNLIEFYKSRNSSILRMILWCQSRQRGGKHRSQFVQIRHDVVTLQCFQRRLALNKKLEQRRLEKIARIQNGAASKLAAFFFMIRDKRKYMKVRRRITLLQALARCALQRVRYAKMQLGLQRIQSTVLMWLCWKRLKAKAMKLLEIRMKQLVALWKACSTPLLDRSMWWSKLKEGCSFTVLGMIEDELDRLYEALLLSLDGGPLAGLSPKSTFEQRFQLIEASELIAKAYEGTPAAKLLSKAGQMRLTEAMRQETLERKQLYQNLKSKLDAQTRDEFYAAYPLEGRKKRKRRFSKLVWNDLTTSKIEVSCSAVLAACKANPLMTPDIEGFFRNKMAQRIHKMAHKNAS